MRNLLIIPTFPVLMVSLGPGIALHLIPSTLYDQMVGLFSESDSQGKIMFFFFFLHCLFVNIFRAIKKTSQIINYNGSFAAII